MSLTLNGTDPLQLSDLYSRPASKVFPPIQNIRNPSKSSYPDNPLVQPNFRQQNHRIIRSCSLISASKIIARQPSFHQSKIKNAPSCSFTNSPDAFFYTISVDPRCPAAQPASRHSDPGALFRLTFTVYAPVHSLFPVSQLEHMRQFLLRSGDASRILTVDHVGDLLRKIDIRRYRFDGP